VDLSTGTKLGGPKAKGKLSQVDPASMEEVVERLEEAFDKRLVLLGVKPATAWRRVYQGRQSLWTLSHDPAVDRGLRNAYFAKRGLVSWLGTFRSTWESQLAPEQLLLLWDTARS
jgi:hypothetical protein